MIFASNIDERLGHIFNCSNKQDRAYPKKTAGYFYNDDNFYCKTVSKFYVASPSYCICMLYSIH